MALQCKADKECMETVQSVIDAYLGIGEGDFISAIGGEHLKLVAAAKGPEASPRSEGLAMATFTYTVQKQHCNRLGNLHGGAAATLFDYCTTMPLCLIAKPGFWSMLGVSRNLSVTYLRPIPLGQTIFIECDIIAAGGRLCALRGTMRRAEDGVVMATCEHEKASIEHLAGSKM
ncbi:hypothetical protein MCOR25_005645 [Pyricularia grisea]|uniref:Thioesterase domain-containing protein n=1 Tax=Pyricularia grisea TaxID=148305 RepID=A0A6P8BB18_PYRGI|nr:uncharacterized protein PgNI_03720 [Pyricularia grisea]KAI6364514.1 hypothetical protein MCOR25_005645 [Pyricularia grisea]TLD12999.1 hypothetical protein PgNI_03720 [Pyricularia grisea]